MFAKCIKTCREQGVIAGTVGEWKGLRTIGKAPFHRIELVTGRVVTVPASCVELVDEKVQV